MTFKKKAISELRSAQYGVPEPIREGIENSIRILEEIPEPINVPDYRELNKKLEAKIAELEKRLKEAECMAEQYENEKDAAYRRSEYLMGYKAAVETLCGRCDQR